MPKLIAIAAMSPSRGIGYQNCLPWHISEDLAFFKEKTLGKTLLMGRKTFESLPGTLKGRKVLVLSRSGQGPRVIHSLDALPEEEIWVCGGADVYRQTLPRCSEVFLTLVKAEPPAVDTYLPAFEEFFAKRETLKETPACTFLHFSK
jgi:dihydrofolate reductase